MKLTVLVIILLFTLFGRAQITEKITVKAGENISAVLSENGLYLFPAFSKGVVTLKDGSSTTARMNFNTFLSEIQFIEPQKGDTLVIAHPEKIDSIVLANTLFYYNKGYVRVIANYEPVKLIIRQIVSYQPIKKGALGFPTPTVTSTENYGAFPDKINYKLLMDEDILLTKKTFYYLRDKDKRQLTANQSGFLKLFSPGKKDMEDYIRNNKINFSKEEDLKKLLAWCIQPG